MKTKPDKTIHEINQELKVKAKKSALKYSEIEKIRTNNGAVWMQSPDGKTRIHTKRVNEFLKEGFKLV